MTIELSLRRRATRARYFGIVWLSIAVAALVLTYISLPYIAGKTVDSVNKFVGDSVGSDKNMNGESLEAKKSINYLHVFVLTTLVLGVSSISFACYLLGKSAFMEMETAQRLCGIADALCIAGADLSQLERAASILIPKANYLSGPEEFSMKDLKSLAEVLKQVR